MTGRALAGMVLGIWAGLFVVALAIFVIAPAR